jgi:signal transduction histidine kinase
MSEGSGERSDRRGPGNRGIATALLESLAARGLLAARDRALRALDLAEGGLAELGRWLPDDAIGRMLVAADADPSLARAVGHRLVGPAAIGIPLYALGLATPEKAYRRAGALLPRHATDTRWSAESIGSGSACLRFEEDAVAAGARAGRGRALDTLCAMRIGMLESVPGLYGLLPARVTHPRCLARGDDACLYEIAWTRHARLGLIVGGGLALVAAVAIGIVGTLQGLPLAASAFPVLCTLLFGVAVGSSVDLHRQLQAVAGARRGHLALFDQVDDLLASKLDALARADAKLEADDSAHPSHARSGGGAGEGGALRSRDEILLAAQEIHRAAGDLACALDEAAQDGGSDGPPDLSGSRALVHSIREWAALIAKDAGDETPAAQEDVDLVALVTRAVAAVRPLLPCAAVIDVDWDDALPGIPCEPVQIEELVAQLVRNAVEASSGLSDAPRVDVSLRREGRGVEIAVEDRGVGIEPTEIDEVFDPFFGDGSAGLDTGFGLPVCLRIVERHGGELRIETEDRPGTRVSILLPSERPADA